MLVAYAFQNQPEFKKGFDLVYNFKTLWNETHTLQSS